MSARYRVAPLFLIRMAGVPFDAIDSLATPGTISLARELTIARSVRAEAKVVVEQSFRSGERPFSEKAYRALRVAVRADKPPVAVSGEQPPAFVNYAAAAGAVAALEAKLAEALALELSAARAALLEASRNFLVKYLVFGADGARAILAGHMAAHSRNAALPLRNKSARKIEQTLLLYLQRVATKNDTFSEFGPSGWGTVVVGKTGVSIDPHNGIDAREVYLERWTAHAMAAAMNRDPDVQTELNGRSMQVPALEPHAFATLLADVQRWNDGPVRSLWSSTLQSVAQLPARFASAEDAATRIQILNEARSRLEAIGATRGASDRFLYSATNPIGEECMRQTGFEVSESLIEQVSLEAAPWIDLWRDSYAFVASRVAAGLRQVFEKAGPSNGALPLPKFLQACETAKVSLTGPGLVALAALAFQEVKAAFRERLRPHAGQEIYDLTVDDCHIVRNNFKYPPFDEYTYPSADLQIAAASVAAVEAGHSEWVVSELHPPVALLHHGVYWGCPDKNKINQAFASTVFSKPNFHFGFFAADFTSHTAVRIFDALPELSYFVAPQRGNPKWKTIPPDAAEVYLDGATGDVCVRQQQSHECLGSFARAWIIPLGFHPFQFGLAPHTPRLRCGRVVVQRRTWTVLTDEVPAGSYVGISTDLVMAMEHLRASKDWPRYIYIRPTEQALRRSGAEGRDKDTKPVFIDLESYLFLEIFHRWLVKAGELEVTEMLPTPDQLLWQEADGRRTFELRTLIVPGS